MDQCVGVELCSAAGPAEAGASGSVVRLLLQCHNLTQPPPTTRSRYCTTLHCGLLGPAPTSPAWPGSTTQLSTLAVSGLPHICVVTRNTLRYNVFQVAGQWWCEGGPPRPLPRPHPSHPTPNHKRSQKLKSRQLSETRWCR